jgi:phosphoribosylformylglycinamidine cyclo-ligase
MEEGRFDLAGFCVGLVDEARLLGPQLVEEGDLVVGLRSSGLHSNGFSMVRRAIEGLDLLATPDGLGRPLADELLEPTRIYVPAVLQAAERGLLHAAAHITGGGIVENLPRVIPEGLGARIDRGAWEAPPIFELVKEASGTSEEEMMRTFNMGIGMALLVPPGAAQEAAATAGEHGVEAVPIGAVVAGEGVTFG